jgi:hypothetical protein
MSWQERCCVGELRYFLLQSDAIYQIRLLSAHARVSAIVATPTEVQSVVRYLALSADCCANWAICSHQCQRDAGIGPRGECDRS